ncbi:MAG: hypothetical protein M5U26_02025 [Planctomycetota bacterium]|nr:hypothetical protein [Planctomycetota bacterium]
MSAARTLLLLLCAGSAWAQEPVSIPDPVVTFNQERPSEAEAAELRALFKQLADDDYDTREQALRSLVQHGPAVLPLAAEFEKDSNAEIAAQARGLGIRVIKQYDGFLPESPALREAGQKVVQVALGQDFEATLNRIAEQSGLRVVVDSQAAGAPRWFADQAGAMLEPTRALDLVRNLAAGQGLAAVPRGDILLLTSADRARQLLRQRHTFDWQDLHLDKEEAARIGDALKVFFPGVSTEVQVGSSALSVRGEAGCIARAARLLALLRLDQSNAQWPGVPMTFDPHGALERLARPVSLRLNNVSLARMLRALGEEKCAAALLVEGKAYVDDPFPAVLQTVAPIRLQLKNLPLGYCLRWIAARAAFVGDSQELYRLAAEVSVDGKAEFRVAPAQRDPLHCAVGGVDVRFLIPADLPDGPKADEVLQEKLLTTLGPSLELFPSFDPRCALRVVRGRALIQASPAAVAAARALIVQWRMDGKPPELPAGLRIDLDRDVDWDGRGLSGGTLLHKLRELGGFEILLEAAPTGEPAYFKITREQAALLPPGRHTLRALLNDLADKASARWVLQWGVVTLVPDPKAHAQPAAPAP